MATSQGTVDYLLEQAASAGDLSARKMFGEYALYCDGKVVALVCDDQLFIKPTGPGRELLDHVTEAPPYPGAKGYFAIPGEDWEDPETLGALIRVTADALPTPPPKKPRKPRQPKAKK